MRKATRRWLCRNKPTEAAEGRSDDRSASGEAYRLLAATIYLGQCRQDLQRPAMHRGVVAANVALGVHLLELALGSKDRLLVELLELT